MESGTHNGVHEERNCMKSLLDAVKRYRKENYLFSQVHPVAALEGSLCEFVYERTRALENENHRLRAALRDVLDSEVVKTAPFAGYSEALDRARTILAQ